MGGTSQGPHGREGGGGRCGGVGKAGVEGVGCVRGLPFGESWGEGNEEEEKEIDRGEHGSDWYDLRL